MLNVSGRRLGVLLMGVMVAMVAGFSPGCKSLPERLAVNGRSFAVNVGGEYKEYVQNDGSLTIDQKQSRIDAVDSQVEMWDEYLNGIAPPTVPK